MRLERSEVSGFFNFQQPFVLDCRQLPEGLIAVVGPNGAGKTSLALDSPIASLFGPGSKSSAFPSRDGSLLTYATSKAAYIDTVWTLEGKGVFRARVNVDRQHRKSDAVLVRVVDGTETPLNDGLVTTYRQAVDSLFPSLRSLLASAYAAQNRRGGFGQLNQNDRIALFRELADLAHLEEKAQTAKRCQQIADDYAEKVRIELQTLERDTSPEHLKVLTDRMDALTFTITSISAAIAEMNTRLAALRDARPALATAVEQYTAERARLDQLTEAVSVAERALATHRAEMASLQTHHDDIVRGIQRRFVDANTALDARVVAMVAQHKKGQQDRLDRIANNEKVLTDAEAIRAAADLVQAATAALSTLRPRLPRVQMDLDLAREQVALRGVKLGEILQAETDLRAAHARAEKVKQIKFGDQCIVDPTCPLVLDVAEAQQRIPELEGLVATKQTLQDGVTHWQQKVDEYRALIRDTEKQIRAEEDVLVKQGPKAGLAPHLQHAEARIAEYRADLISMDAQHLSDMEAITTERSQVDQQRFRELQTATGELRTRAEKALAREQALSDDVKSAQLRHLESSGRVNLNTGAEAALHEHDATAMYVTSAHQSTEMELVRAQTEHAALSAQRRELDARLAVVTGLRDKLRVLEDEGMSWGVLARACGRDGLQRLEIDAAGPVVSDLANSLLQVGYGTRFSVELVTQVATADGKDVKEKFTIDAIDNANGGDRRDIGDLSGGERVVVEESVRAALQCYVSLRSRQPSRTIWRDETTGALDPENAPRYVAMLRKLREISRAHQVFFVTHSMDCAHLADAQVHVKDGQVTVVLPPF